MISRFMVKPCYILLLWLLKCSYLGGRVACGVQFSTQYLEFVWPRASPG